MVLSSDRHLLTNAHVVIGADRGEVEFVDGTTAEVSVVGSDPCPTWPCSRQTGTCQSLRSSAAPRHCASDTWWWPSATPSAWQAVSPRGRQRTRTLPAHTIGRGHTLRRGRDPDRRGSQPRQLRRGPRDARGRVVGINTAVAGVGLGLAVPINATTERIIGPCAPGAACSAPTWGSSRRRRRCPETSPSAMGSAQPCGSSRWWRAARRRELAFCVVTWFSRWTDSGMPSRCSACCSRMRSGGTWR